VAPADPERADPPGGTREGRLRFFVLLQAIAFVYYQVSWLAIVLCPALSHRLNADFEDDAERAPVNMPAPAAAAATPCGSGRSGQTCAHPVVSVRGVAVSSRRCSVGEERTELGAPDLPGRCCGQVLPAHEHGCCEGG